MKTVLVLLAVILVFCEGYNPEYRRSKSKRNRYVVEDSYEDDYGEISIEETEEDSAPRIERKMRASVHELPYGYSKSHKRRDDREYEVKMRKPSYSEKKGRGKYSTYETNPHKTLKKDIVARQRNSVVEVKGRKKDHRSAPVYESMYPYPSPPAPYSIPLPVVPHLTKVPCGAYSGKPYPTPAHHVPVSHVPAPQVPPYHAPTHQVPTPHVPVHQVPAAAYHEQPSYQVPPPPYTPPVFTPPTYNPPMHTTTSPQYLPQPKPLYHHQPVQTQPEAVHQPLYYKPGQHPYYQQQKPGPHFPAPPAYHQPYQPSYKSMEPTPSFAAPVSEDHQEPPHHPVISAFPTTSTTTQHAPTVPADRDQTTQNVDNHTQRPAADADETKNQRKASDDEPEEEKRVITQPTSTTGAAMTTTTSSPRLHAPSTTVENEK
ncbi:uncharacterized protein LOC134216866 [Armigeres subalbatus]|uniref:uncharacterized protein LOC134216866 n=1 Tax=Armigeres subalbatus TaxID=124917 RepID=UPI002ED0DB15